MPASFLLREVRDGLRQALWDAIPRRRQANGKTGRSDMPDVSARPLHYSACTFYRRQKALTTEQKEILEEANAYLGHRPTSYELGVRAECVGGRSRGVYADRA